MNPRFHKEPANAGVSERKFIADRSLVVDNLPEEYFARYRKRGITIAQECSYSVQREQKTVKTGEGYSYKRAAKTAP